VLLMGRGATSRGLVRVVIHDPIETAGLDRSQARSFAERVRQVLAPDAESDCEILPRA
jgi:hypothetical protein